MIGTIDVDILGKSYTLRADWRAGTLINARVADPVTILTEFSKAQAMEELGLPYRNAFEFNMVSSMKIIHCAVEAIGSDLTVNEIGDYFMGEKMKDAIDIATRFILLFASEAVDLDKGAKKKTRGKPRKSRAGQSS